MLDKIIQIYLKFSDDSRTGDRHPGSGRGGADETEVSCLTTAVPVQHVVPVIADCPGLTPRASVATARAGGTGRCGGRCGRCCGCGCML